MKPIRTEYLPFGKPNFSEAEIDAVSQVMRSGWIGMGKEVQLFEKELAEYVNSPHVVTVNSCTSALFLALLVEGIGEGDEVICPSLTWCSSANVALYLGAKVIFCDVDPDTLCVTPETILAKLSPKTKAVVVVHMGGLAADIEAIKGALPSSVSIIEDAAHALGARYSNGEMVGSSGNLTCFSFYANKNLSTGEGGAISVFDKAKCDRLMSLRQHGLCSDAWKRFTHPQAALTPALTELGYKMNYIDILAAIGRAQLFRLPEFHQRRLEIANYYINFLNENYPSVDMQAGLGNDEHAHHLFVIKLVVENMSISRNELVLEMRAQNIGASIHYSPLHKMPFYYCEGQTLSNTEYLAECIVTLPISASMSIADAKDVCEGLASSLGDSHEYRN